ncbi:hypothetical protein BBP00_00006375 [Phytophthora kernoviae]|uniref:Uncharacterized protein n=1 Tax=Phytophthora kernoviae TaxID=325452 RepID=A0A3F2RMQ0_9STRA|nr:hypothetical protein BBP00_00006375 [Phytophthora kernoviae]
MQQLNGFDAFYVVQIENARSREMSAHGELVQKLESELENRRTGEAELRLTATKLRTEICRLEAELSVANGKTRRLLVQQDAQLAANAKRADEFKALCEENERRLQVAREKGEKFLEEKLQLNAEATEIEKLSVQLACSQKEVEASSLCCQHLVTYYQHKLGINI